MTVGVLRARSRTAARHIHPGLRQPLAVVGVVIVAAWVVLAVFAPLIAPADPLAQTFTASVGPSWQHPFGTDELGRDVLSRVLYGARVTLPLAVIVVVVAATVGAIIVLLIWGVVAGRQGRT